MAEPSRDQLKELKVQQKRAVLAAVIDPSRRGDRDTALDELKGLVQTAGTEVVGTLVQARERPHPATCLGRGKVEELKQLAESTDAELIVFDNNLSPAQGKRLEEETGKVIVDRSEVILDIFASTARTYEARLQVELAQLLYFRPRLKRLWTHLERIDGGIGAGRGPGEKQLETDRRLLDRRVAELRRKLEEVEQRRERAVAARHEYPTVSLVGYTNAGKSTLMNALTDAGVYVADKLFATLDTRTRRWQLPHLGTVLLSDTVGFIRNLPHHLVASFKSTLEEARHADLLLHVVDASNPEVSSQIAAVEKVLDEIGVDRSSMILVLNKTDACADRAIVDVLRATTENAVAVSAYSGEGLDRLTAAVAERLANSYAAVTVETSAGNGRLLAWLAEHAEIRDRQYTDSTVTLDCRVPRSLLKVLSGMEGATVREPGSGSGVVGGIFTAVDLPDAGGTPEEDRAESAAEDVEPDEDHVGSIAGS
ncbi:MAG: GTPase HflX [Planctomycetaceae bacterium]|nr:GTPase HflX [Planctomycetaceae bacterium]